MKLDGKLLARAKQALEEKRRNREELYERRLERVYRAAPRVRELDGEIKQTVSGVIAAALKPGGDAEAVEELRMRNLALQSERRSELLRAGFTPDYISDDYMCGRCRDTGFVGAEVCPCLMELYKKEQREALSSLLKLGGETFDAFDLSYYDDVPDKATGTSPRQNMEFVYETCVQYARKFGERSMNLFFIGAPGLGKTFLSACIARVVAEKGHSVVYDTASSIFGKFEDDKFSRSQNPEEARSEVKRCLECDLLILDDLGTELTTAFTTSALYELINTRLITGKKTLVSSNLTTEELRRRYSVQIMSRLEGEYQVLTFHGDDIRRKKRI